MRAASIRPLLCVAIVSAGSLTCGDGAGPDPDGVAQVVIAPDSGTIDTGDSLQLTVLARNAAGDALSGKPFTWSTLDDTLVVVTGSGLVRGIWPGMARVVATSEAKADTASVRIRPRITTLVVKSPDTLRSISEVGMLSVSASIGGRSYYGGSYTWEVADTAVVHPYFGPPPPGADTVFVQAAHNGSTVVRVREAGGATDSARVIVRQRVANIFVDLIPVLHLYRGCSMRPHANPVDARGYLVADAVVQWSSTDTTLATVDATGLITARGAGVDTIVVQAQNFTKRVPLNVDAPPAMTLQVLSAGTPGLPTATVGRRQYVTALGRLTGALTTAIGKFRVEISDTSILASSPPDTTVSQNAGESGPVRLIGRQQGQVTLTPYLCDGAGSAQTFTVTRPQLAFFTPAPDSARTDDPPGSLTFTTQDSTGTIQYPADTVTVRSTATNTTVLLFDSVYRHVPPGAIGRVTNFSFVDTGATRIIVSDSAGLYLPDTTTAIQVRYPPIFFPRVGDTLHLGMRQRAYPSWDPDYVSVDRIVSGAPLPLDLTTTDNAVARITPISVAIPVGNTGEIIDIVSLDQRGTATIRAHANRHRDAKVVVVVGRPAIKLVAQDYPHYPGEIGEVQLLPADSATGVERLATETVTFSLVSSDSNIVAVDSSTLTIPVGEYPAATSGIRFKAPGVAIITASDPRPVPYAYAGASAALTVTAPYLTADASISVGIGQQAVFSALANGPVDPSDVVQVSHNHPTVATLANTFATQFIPGYFIVQVTGVSTGVDTVVATLPGFQSDSGTIVVGTGTIELAQWPSGLQVNQTWPLELKVFAPNGEVRSTAVSTTFTLTANGNIEFSKDGVPVSSLTLEAGEHFTQFTVTAKAAGTGTVTVSAPNYTPVTKSVTISP